jgi:hypothetical protein
MDRFSIVFPIEFKAGHLLLAPIDPAEFTRLVGFNLTRMDAAAQGLEKAPYASSMALLQSEGVTVADLNTARAFVGDLDIVAPGTIASLQLSGAGNDPRLIRAAIKEAQRRGIANERAS